MNRGSTTWWPPNGIASESAYNMARCDQCGLRFPMPRGSKPHGILLLCSDRCADKLSILDVLALPL